MRIVAIDQGTTSTRALAVETDGSCRVVHSERHEQHHPGAGRVEHDGEELVANIRRCLAAAGKADVIGIDNQGESCLAWDAQTKRPISPVIVWQDARTSDQVERLKSDGAETLTLTRAGLPLDPYFSATKLRWLLDHAEGARDLAQAGRLRLGTTDAFFLNRLTGTCATDITTASRTSLMNLETGNWDPELCQLFGVPGECLPEIRPTVGSFGEIDGVPVAASMVDQQAALYGHGCRAPGDVKITFGTGAFALGVTGERIVRLPERGLLPTVAWQIGPKRSYAVDGGVYNAGSAVDWALRLGLAPDLAALDSFDRPPAIERSLAFVPALSGLACPHWDRSAAGLWIGMGLETDARDMLQALLEGIALRTAEVIEAMGAALPIGAPVSVDGGLVRSDYFVRFLASCLGRSLVVRTFDELTAFGCAGLAAAAGGRSLTVPREGERVIEPVTDGAAWRARFGEAVSRAKGWRHAAPVRPG
ncbi:FGGY family carbohydrate kinase [Hypericibacter sp.]|uniref:FGGY family carbohydrate kinase n=1 Tax=Hypericibacter sp. TaxID=2705401 RepID=UPI003D6D46CD